ncbi:MAG: acyl-CoA dehydrogenase family protein [Acidimicrobiia bacterium]
MIDFTLPTELVELRDLVSRFVGEQIVPVEQALDPMAPAIPATDVAALQAKAREAGLWYFDAPAEYGGCGLSSFESVVVWEAASHHRFCHPTIGAGAFGMNPPFVLFAGTPEQREKWVKPAIAEGWSTFNSIAEPSGGTDPARAIKTTATRDGDTWVLNGTKMWATGADRSKFGVVYARAPEGISCFIVDMDRPGITVSPIHTIRDLNTTMMVLDNVVLPADQIVGAPGKGMALATGWLQRGRLCYAARSIGVAEAALKIAVDWAKERETFGAKLATRQAIQFSIADSRVELDAARWLTWHAAWKHDSGVDARREVAMAKLNATETGFRVVDRMMQILGAMGMSRELPLEKWFRDLRVARVVEGSSEILRRQISRTEIGPAVND